jgi:hypothetical protein
MLGTWMFTLAVGCHQHPLMDYRPLDQAGMNSSVIDRMKTLNISDSELQQLVRLKGAGVSDDTCVTLISTAHDRKHPFSSADSVANLLNARYTESDVLTYAQADKLDSISGDAVMLRLIGLSDPMVNAILQRDLQGLPTISSAAIGRLKNTGLSEKQILELISQGIMKRMPEKRRETMRTPTSSRNAGVNRGRSSPATPSRIL